MRVSQYNYPEKRSRKPITMSWDVESIEMVKRRSRLLGVPFSRFAEDAVMREMSPGPDSTVLTVVNLAKRSGKTMTAVYLSIALGRLGQKVLLVDCDPQADATRHFFGEDALTFDAGLFDAFRRQDDDGPSASFGRTIRPTGYAGVDMVPMIWPTPEGNYLNYAGAELQLASCLKSVQGAYDFVVIDSAQEGGLVDNAIAAQVAGSGQSRFLIPWRESACENLLACCERRIGRTSGFVGFPERPAVFLLDSPKVPGFLLGRGRFISLMPKPDASRIGEYAVFEEAIDQWIPIAEEVVEGL